MLAIYLCRGAAALLLLAGYIGALMFWETGSSRLIIFGVPVAATLLAVILLAAAQITENTMPPPTES